MPDQCKKKIYNSSPAEAAGAAAATAAGCFSSRGAAPLVKIGKFASPSTPVFSDQDKAKAAKKNANLRYKTLSKLQYYVRNGALPAASTEHRCCSTGPVPYLRDEAGGEDWRPNVEMHRYEGDGGEAESARHGYVYLRRCSSALVCPVCGARIAYRRSLEIEKITNIMLERGHGYIMVTYTARHLQGSSLYDFALRFAAAQRDLKSGKAWAKFREQYGLMYEITTRETTMDRPGYRGRKTGAHYHMHSIWYLDAPMSKSVAAEVEQWVRGRWAAALEGVGLDAREDLGVTLSLPRTLRDGTIDTAEGVRRAAEYMAKGVAYEMSSPATKTSTGTVALSKCGEKAKHKARRVTIWEYMRQAVESGDPVMLHTLNEYIRAVKGRPYLRASRGLYEYCGMTEVKDEDLCAGKKDELVYEFFLDSFFHISRQGAQARLLAIADDGGAGAVGTAVEAAEEGVILGDDDGDET